MIRFSDIQGADHKALHEALDHYGRLRYAEIIKFVNDLEDLLLSDSDAKSVTIFNSVPLDVMELIAHNHNVNLKRPEMERPFYVVFVSDKDSGLDLIFQSKEYKSYTIHKEK